MGDDITPPAAKRTHLDCGTSQDRLSSHLFQSSSYLALERLVRSCRGNDFIRKLVRMYGPKGVGKSSALCLLKRKLLVDNEKCILIDLINKQAESHLKSCSEKNNYILLLDNAQLCTKINHDFSSWKFVIAAFSPSAQLSDCSIDKELTPSLAFYFSPFNVDDASKLLEVHGYTIIPNSRTDRDGSPFPMLTEDKKMEDGDFWRLLFLTHGNPKFIVDFLLTGNFNTMDTDINSEITEVMKKQNSFTSNRALCDAILRSFMGGGVYLQLVKMGLAFMCGNKQYLAHFQYLIILMELGYVKGWNGPIPNFKSLEVLTQFVLMTKSHDLTIPAVTSRLVQEHISDNVDLHESSILLLQLRNGHPAIDHLVVDNSSKVLYMVQTSFRRYSDIDVKRDAIHTMLVDNTGKSVSQYYKEKFGISTIKYVYATFRPTKVQDKLVNILKLNCFPHLLQRD